MDARIRYTKLTIRNEFFALLQEKPLNKITVTAICERAGINRATFYKYYDNPFDLMHKLETALIGELEKTIGLLPKKTIRSVFAAVLEHLKKESETYAVLFSENGDREFVEKILSMVYQENMRIIQFYFPHLKEEEQKMLFYFLGEGCNGILKYWVGNGMKEEVGEIVSFADKIVESLNRNLK